MAIKRYSLQENMSASLVDRGSKLEIEYRIDEDFLLVKEAELTALEARNQKLEAVFKAADKYWTAWTSEDESDSGLIEHSNALTELINAIEAAGGGKVN